MTRKLFWQDPYQTELATHIRHAETEAVYTTQNIFYALSGGQESDTGDINGLPVLAAAKDGLDIRYTLAPGHGLQPGVPVTMRIDWPRRYSLMRLHFAAELVLESVYRLCPGIESPGIEKIGAHIAADKARIDFVSAENFNALLPDLRANVQALIEAAHPIRSEFSDEQAQRRVWEIEGFARIPCGGTHLKNSSEVGPLTLKRNNTGKGKERVEIYLAS